MLILLACWAGSSTRPTEAGASGDRWAGSAHHLLASTALPSSPSTLKKGGERKKKCEGEEWAELELWRVGGAEAGTLLGKGVESIEQVVYQRALQHVLSLSCTKVSLHPHKDHPYESIGPINPFRVKSETHI